MKKVFGSVLIIFVLMVANKFIPVISGNQEQYLGQAKQFFNPDWIKGAFSLTEPAGPRLIFDFVMGFFLNQFHFETVAFVSTILNIFLLAFPLSRLSEKFGLKNLSLALWWQLVMLSSIGFGAFFGGEWFIGEIEPKTLAYIGVLWGLVFYFEEKFLSAALAFGLGALFHPLASGWTFAVVCLDQLCVRNFKRTAQMAGLFLLINLPLIIYYVPGVLLSGPKEVNGVSTSWIYTYFRVPHHTAPFLSTDFFLNKFLPGILKMISLVVFFQIIKKRVMNPFYLKVIKYLSVNAAMLLLLIAVAYVDHQGTFLKFYLFRSVATFQLLAFLLIFGFLPEIKKRKKMLLSVLGLLALLRLGSVVYKNDYLIPLKSRTHQKRMQDLYDFAKATPEGTLFANADINLAKADSHFDSFSRMTHRDLYVNFKFLPSDRMKLAEWYRRILVVKDERFEGEGIDYVISHRDMPLLKKVFESMEGVRVYEL